jgi:hypothetical protein
VMISAMLILTTYIAGSRIASPTIALLAALFLTINEAFLAQSGLYLPEVFLALVTLWLVLSYLEKQKVLVALFGTLALLTKESAIVILFTLMVWQLTRVIILRKDPVRTTVEWLIVLIIPIVLLSTHFAFQKIIYGWFFFPEHVGLMSFELRSIVYKMKLSFLELFERQGIEWFMYTFALIGSLLFRPVKRPWLPLLITLLYITAIKVLFGRWTIPLAPTFIVTLLCFTIIWILKYLPLFRLDERKGEFLNIAFLFTIGFIIFTSFNFYTDRYLLSIIPMFILGFIIFIDWTISRYSRYMTPFILLILILVKLIQIGSDDKIGDTRLSYIDAINIQQSLIRKCEELNLYDAAITATFMEEFYMQHDIAGYLSGPRSFQRVTTNFEPQTQFILFSNASPNALLEKRADLNFNTLLHVEQGKVWGEIQERP